MNRLALAGVLVFLAGVATAAAGAPSASRRPAPVAVSFWNGRDGLVALTTFRSCRPGGAAEEIVVERTGDGGATWRRVHTACATVAGWGGSVALATAGPRSALLGVPGGLLRTDDGGRTWSLLRGRPPVSLSFATAKLGWALSRRGSIVLRETRDGGRSWRPLRMPCGGEDAKVALATPSRAWLICLSVAGAGNQGKVLYETRNAGKSWQLRARATFGGRSVGNIGLGGYPISIAFRSDGTGWLPEGRGATLVSRDAGRRWSAVRMTTPETRNGISVSFASSSVGFLLIDDYVHRRFDLERTMDGGKTWRLVHRWPQRA
jgi:photosystem II stability/assembly factor-like uncharacterized protein